MNEIRLWVCGDCGEIRPRTADTEDDEPDLPNHHAVWVPYIARPELTDGSPCRHTEHAIRGDGKYGRWFPEPYDGVGVWERCDPNDGTDHA